MLVFQLSPLNGNYAVHDEMIVGPVGFFLHQQGMWRDISTLEIQGNYFPLNILEMCVILLVH